MSRPRDSPSRHSRHGRKAVASRLAVRRPRGDGTRGPCTLSAALSKSTGLVGLPVPLANVSSLDLVMLPVAMADVAVAA